MAKPFHKLLAESLENATQVAHNHILQSNKLARRDRERLVKAGWLQPIVIGWYFLSSPQAQPGETTAWYACFWAFVGEYLSERFNHDYCLSAESSLDIQVGNTIIPEQVIAITKKGGNFTLVLPHNTSILTYQDKKNFPETVETKQHLQVMPLGLCLTRVSKAFFQKQRSNAEIALLMIKDASEITKYLLSLRNVAAAGRLAGAYRQLGKDHFADTIIQTMGAAGFSVKEDNPFSDKKPLLRGQTKIISPYCARIKSLWQQMRLDIIKLFPKRRPSRAQLNTIIHRIDDVYVHDAYHSLSIEGYRVSEELIEKIKTGDWHPDQHQNDREQMNALAARGYYEAFLQVKESIKTIFQGRDPITVINHDLSAWYRALFSPSVTAGILSAEHLAGFRDHQVYIRNSLHTPVPVNALLDSMETFFQCLAGEDNPIVRAVLGHFIFVFIHPYMDGNGRIARFLMNTLWCAAGYPWTIIRFSSRQRYFATLEKASVTQDIKPFIKFLAEEMAVKW